MNAQEKLIATQQREITKQQEMMQRYQDERRRSELREIALRHATAVSFSTDNARVKVNEQMVERNIRNAEKYFQWLIKK
jgi:hypothetical protein